MKKISKIHYQIYNTYSRIEWNQMKKKFMQMRYACTPNMVGKASLISEIKLVFKYGQYPFQTMDYNPWRSKHRIEWNWLKKFMQVDVDKI